MGERMGGEEKGTGGRGNSNGYANFLIKMHLNFASSFGNIFAYPGITVLTNQSSLVQKANELDGHVCMYGIW